MTIITPGNDKNQKNRLLRKTIDVINEDTISKLSISGSSIFMGTSSTGCQTPAYLRNTTLPKVKL